MSENLKSENTTFLSNTVMDFCEDIITVKDLDFRIIDYNKAFIKHIKISDRDKIIGKKIKDLVDEKSAEFLRRKIERVRKTLKSQKYLFTIIIDGKKIYLKQCTNPIIQNGELIGYITISRDVTEEENLKREMLQTNSQLNTLLEYIPLNVYMKDKNKNYITGSKHARDFVEKGIDAYATPNGITIDMEAVADLTEKEDNYVLETKKLLRKEKCAIDFDGIEHWYRVVKAPIFSKTNEINGLVTITKNIDLEKKLENQKDLFIATLVHDMKNPLLAQISSLNLLLKGMFGELKPEQREILELTAESANYMKEMLHSLLTTYKYDNGIVTLEKTDFNIDNLFRVCLAEHKALASENNIKVEYSNTLNEDEKILCADEKQIRRVISNLINNGLNYSDEGTTFTILVYRKDENIVMEFKNISPEIPQEVLDCIFEKYVTTASQYQKIGCGLGMYLSKKVVEAHKGKIYTNCKGKNNDFIIELPFKTSSEKPQKIAW